MMNSRSEEVIKQLNRLANDRTLSVQVRNRVRDAAYHVREQEQKLLALLASNMDNTETDFQLKGC